MGARRKEAADLDHEKYGDPLVVGVVEVGAVECSPGTVALRSGNESHSAYRGILS